MPNYEILLSRATWEAAGGTNHLFMSTINPNPCLYNIVALSSSWISMQKSKGENPFFKKKMLRFISLLLPHLPNFSLQVITSETSAFTAWGICSGSLSPLICLPTSSRLAGTRWRWSAWRGGCGSRCCARLRCPSSSTGACRSAATSTCSWGCEHSPLLSKRAASWQETAARKGYFPLKSTTLYSLNKRVLFIPGATG